MNIPDVAARTGRPQRAARTGRAVLQRVAVAALVAAGPLGADMSRPRPSRPAEPSPQQQAAAHYEKGLDHQRKAWDFEAKALSADSEKDRDKHLQRAQKEYRQAIDEQHAATATDPRFHEAFNALGYAYRKTGEYAKALEAYDRALAIESDYAEAVEYRGEAFLGLNRVAEAQEAYEWLFRREPQRARTLLLAAKRWVAERRADPAGVAVEVVDGMSAWVDAKEATAEDLRGVGEDTKTQW